MFTPCAPLRARLRLLGLLYWGGGRQQHAIAIIAATVLMMLVQSEVSGIMYVAERFHFILKKSRLYFSWGGEKDWRDYYADYDLKFPSTDIITTLWAPDERRGLILSRIRFRPKQSRFGMPWIDTDYDRIPDKHYGSIGLPLGWLYLPVIVWISFLIAKAARMEILEHGCNDCGYNLLGNTSGRCPECGASVDNKHQMAHARPSTSNDR
jgi:hypothetical protein